MTLPSSFLSAVIGLVFATIALATPPQSVKDLDWMAGCWSYDGRDAGSIEQWMTPVDGELIGMSRIVSDHQMVAFEFMRIAHNIGGQLEFVASPSGQETTHFQLVSLTRQEVVFENAGHDFPQRVIYRRIDSEHLLGRIEGRTDEGERHVDFPMTKTACIAA